jgi:hypothetical protein
MHCQMRCSIILYAKLWSLAQFARSDDSEAAPWWNLCWPITLICLVVWVSQMQRAWFGFSYSKHQWWVTCDYGGMCSVVMCVAAFILQLEAQHAQSHKSLKTSIHAISRLLGRNPATPGIPCLAILVWNGLCRQTAFYIAGSMIFQYFTKQTSNFILPIKL